MAKKYTADTFEAGHQILFTKNGVNEIYTDSGVVPDVSQLAFGTNNTERMRIDSSGNVGIGATGPVHDLQVGDGTVNNQSIQVSSNSESALYLTTPNSTAQSVIGFGNSQFATINTRGRILYQSSTTPASNSMQFNVAFNEIMRLQHDNAYFPQPIRIGGNDLDHELDDYEEGTWVPEIYNTSGQALAYGSQQGKYVKVGRQVFFKIYIHVSNVYYMSTSGVVYGTLPFANVDTNPSGIAEFFPAMNNLTPFGSSANNQHAYKIKCWLSGQTFSSQYKFYLPPTAPTAGTSNAAAALGNLMQTGNFSFHITGSFYTAS